MLIISGLKLVAVRFLDILILASWGKSQSERREWCRLKMRQFSQASHSAEGVQRLGSASDAVSGEDSKHLEIVAMLNLS